MLFDPSSDVSCVPVNFKNGVAESAVVPSPIGALISIAFTVPAPVALLAIRRPFVARPFSTSLIIFL
jgi:hypothetical protein